MKPIKKHKSILIIIIVIAVIYGFYTYISKPWQLSLYGNAQTLMRLDYDSKESCLSAGKTYYRDGTTQYQRYDCGYKCNYIGDKNDLTNSPVCEQICDNYGCK